MHAARLDGTACPSVLSGAGLGRQAGGVRRAGERLRRLAHLHDGRASYFQCVNTAGETDLFGNLIPLMSPNGGVAGVFRQCGRRQRPPTRTTCTPVPALSANGDVGVCTPVIQNGGCEPNGHDGQACPAINYPYLGYTCQTIETADGSTQACVPPVASGMGAAVVERRQLDPGAGADAQPGVHHRRRLRQPEQVLDGACVRRLAGVSGRRRGLRVLRAADLLVVGDLHQRTLCENSDGQTCGPSDTCYQSQAIYGGICGPTNPGWLAKASSITNAAGATWLQSFKDGCPLAYSYQYDDPSSNWDCTNTQTGLNDYRVVFCGSAGR